MIHRRIPFALLAMLLATTPLIAAEEDATAEEGAMPPATTGVVEQVGPALPGKVAALYVPPTRSSQPMVATESEVYFLNSKTPNWDRVYTVAPKDQPAVAIAAYTKSSKAIYIAHSTGVATTRNGGGTWTEGHPSGYSASSLYALTVHPTDRKQAIVAVQGAAWQTIDAGANWLSYELPGSQEKGVALNFTTLQEKPVLVYCSDKAVYLSGPDLKTWMTISRQPSGPALADTQGNLTVVLTSGGILEAYDLSRPGYRLARPVGAIPGASLALDSSAFGGVFLAGAEGIGYLQLGSDAPPTTIAGTPGDAVHLQAHPRVANAIYWSTGSQVFRVVEAATSFPAAPLSVDNFQRPSEPTEAVASAPTAGSVDAEREAGQILDEIMATQAPVEEVVAQALKFASYHPKEAEQWKRDIRRKNLIPTLAVSGGARERDLDRYDRVTNVDRFGAETQNHLYADDDVTYMREYAVELKWNLSGLLFDKEQLMVSEETRKRNEQRNALITQVTDLYFRRLELLVQHRMNNPASVGEAVQAKLRLRQMTATLNEITGQQMFDDFPGTPANR